MNIGQAYEWTNELANKSASGGYVDPDLFTIHATNAQMSFFSTQYNNVEEYTQQVKLPRHAYADTQRVLDNMRPWLKNKTLVLDGNGECPLPDDYKHPAAFFCTYQYNVNSFKESLDCDSTSTTVVPKTTIKRVELLSSDTYGFRLGSNIEPPTLEYPISKFEANTIYITPVNTYLPVLTYLREPTPPKFGYTGTKRMPIYDPTTSVDWEAPSDCHNELIYTVLTYIGIRVTSAEITAFAERKLQQGS